MTEQERKIKELELKLRLAQLEKEAKEKDSDFDLLGAPFNLVRGTCDVAEKFVKSILPF